MKMESGMENRDGEVRRLQGCINDLVSLLALPAMWGGREPPQIVETLLDALVGMLRLDFLYARLNDPGADSPFEAVRVAGRRKVEVEPREVGRALEGWLTHDPPASPRVMPHPAGAGEVAVAPFWLGLGGESGVLVAGSGRADFPTETETLLLKVAANQAAIALEGVRLLSGRRRAEEAVRRTQQELSDFVENAAVGMHWIGPDGTVLWANRAELEMLGYAREEYVGHHVAEFHADPPVIEDMLRRLAQGETLDEHPARLRCKDGLIRDVLIDSNVLWEEGKFVRTRCFTRDITERKRAEEALVERARLAALGADVGAALIQSDALPEMLRRAAEAMVRHLGAAFARIWTLDEEEQVLELQASAGMYTHLDGPHSRVPVGKYKIGLIAAERAPHLTNDVPHDPRVSDKEWAEREGMVAFTGYPLIIEDRLVGVMALFSRQPLTKATLEAMSSVANGIALGIERKRAESGLREQTEVVETINRVGQTVSAELDLHRLVQAVTDAATELTGAHFGSFFYNVLGEEGASYMLYTLSGVPREAFAHFPMPRATDLFGPTFRGEGVVRISDVKKDPRFGKNSPYYGMPEGHLPVTSYLAVPVVSRSGEVLGGLFFGHPEAGVFTARDEALVLGLAAPAAVAMDNARLYEAAKRERGQAEAARQQTVNVLESITDGFVTFDREWRITYLNQQGALLLQGLPGVREGLIGKNHWEQFPDAVGTIIEEQYRRAVAEQVTVEFELFYPPLNAWINIRAFPSEDGLSVFFRDVTERKRAEEAQLNQQRWLEDLLNLAPIPILLIEPGTARVTFANRAADEMAGGEFPKGRPAEEYHTVYHCTDRDGRRIPDEKMPGVRVASGERLENFQMDWHTPRGVRSVLLFADTLPAMHGHPATCILVFQDVSRLKQIETELRGANRLKDEFLATVSHELRTPLTAILGWATMLRGNKFDEATAASALETIERNARAQSQLIEDLMDVSRIITGKLRLDVRPVDLASVVEAAVEAVRPAAEAKGIRLQRVLDTYAGPVPGDPVRLQQVVWNLLSNAIKFTPKGGRVQVRLERVNSHVEIVVSDTGPGISPDFLPHAFERFRQADAAITRKHGGLGLGLAIVRHLVELHGGAVSVESGGEGQGATFSVQLPLMIVHGEVVAEERRHPRAEAPGEALCRPQLDGLRVLVVDDERDARLMLKAMLAQCGAEVAEADSAAGALAAFEEFRPDVLVSDIGMPEEDGYSLIRKIRALAPERGGRTPAAALTAYAGVEDRKRALLAGYQVHVPKPVDPTELLAVVASLAGRTGRP